MKICNAYCGIGGNRRLWPEGHDITAVEMNPDIAKIYQDFFPRDTVIVGNAHDYLLEHYKEYDFIWASPPCPSHSDIRRCSVHGNRNPGMKAIYPDMTLYQEILLLQYFADKKTKYVVENVIPYYEPLVAAQKSGRHLFWSNFIIQDIKPNTRSMDSVKKQENELQYNLDKYDMSSKQKLKCLRNCVDPKLGLHIYNCAFRDKQLSLI